eukprot:CAMPEP_0115103884 /NCGR_PEP_ID=MMETSP0227-20121206/34904_1 /TAXON_ID=89957 /ORGANISM="Polarella glacialis, Strain CCMP 1383" /LENGTH=77 /DNA_ID=CAMNT_0002500533 /DNA_START=168 /DNA_END=401 /DNA_ORIENTATION=-
MPRRRMPGFTTKFCTYPSFFTWAIPSTPSDASPVAIAVSGERSETVDMARIQPSPKKGCSTLESWGASSLPVRQKAS